MDERIVFNDDILVGRMEQALEPLRTLLYDDQLSTLLGERFARKMVDGLEAIHACRHEPYTVVVIGDFKRGKSSLINALLGEKAAVVNVTPETMSINRISYGVRDNRITLSDGRQVRISDEELCRDELEKILSKLNEPAPQLDIRRPNEILKNMVLIDTPGMGDAAKDYEDTVKDSLQRADAVIYVYNVLYPLSMSEQLFLKAVLCNPSHPALILAGNRTDMLGSEKNAERVREASRKRIEDLLPDADVLMVSALDEVCRKKGVERPEPGMEDFLAREFDRLREKLNTVYQEKADCLISDRMQRIADNLLFQLNAELDALEKGLNMSAEEAAKEARIRKKEKDERIRNQAELILHIKEEVQGFRSEAQSWLNDFLERMRRESESLENSGTSTDDILRYYNLYCIDMLQRALDTCLDIHKGRLYEDLDAFSEETGKRLAETFGAQKNYNFSVNLNNRVWTKGDTVGFVVSRIPYKTVFGLAADFAASIAAGSMREHEKRKNVDDIVDRIKEQFTALSAAVSRAVDELYTDMQRQAFNLLTAFFTEQEEEEDRIQQELLDISGREQTQKKEMRGKVNAVRNVLKNTAERMPAVHNL